MPRYIDADKLQRHGKRGGVVYWRDIEAQPPADVVEVVRCKDCKYATYDKSIDRYNCRNWGLYGDENTEADDFCSYGEKRDD